MEPRIRQEQVSKVRPAGLRLGARRSASRLPLVVALVAALLAIGAPSGASADSDERWLLHLEPALALPLGDPQSSLFGPGISGTLGVSRSLAPAILVGARLRGGFLFDGPEPSDPSIVDPGMGVFSSFGITLRLRPLGSGDDPRRGSGLWVEGLGGVALTGDLIRATFEAGIGWGFSVGSTAIGPAIRYVHIFQPSSNFEDRDAKILTLGLEITFLDGVPEEEEAEQEVRRTDQDYDGLYDDEDDCPTEAEDFDGFEDEDGCPDRDNDQDGVPDAVDDCPEDPEDLDGFDDEDGCPELDNDQDGFLDDVDACPDEPEIINGVDDDDGCPDEGLIELIDDRIVLEETVLFDFERARVKSAARPVLAAIVALVEQHPEWTQMRIEGHTDVRGDANYNRRLSERRARNVMRALVLLGVDDEKIDSIGFGADHPREEGDTEAAHQHNRRVEFVVRQRREVDENGQPIGGDDVMTFEADGATPGDAADEGEMRFDSDAAAAEAGSGSDETSDTSPEELSAEEPSTEDTSSTEDAPPAEETPDVEAEEVAADAAEGTEEPAEEEAAPAEANQ